MKLLQYISLVTLFIGTLSCQSNEEIEKPVNLIEKTDFIQIMMDVYVIEGSFKTRSKLDETVIREGRILYKELFKENNISEEQFDVSYQYYMHDKDEFDEILNDVVLKLEAKLETKEQEKE